MSLLSKGLLGRAASMWRSEGGPQQNAAKTHELEAVVAEQAPPRAPRIPDELPDPARSLNVVVVSDIIGATQEISFQQPLAPAVVGGLATLTMLPGKGLEAVLPRLLEQPDRISVLILSRYSGPHVTDLLRVASAAALPLVYHLDDDLFEVPAELGPSKFRHYRDPGRLQAMTAGVEAADVVYASTKSLGLSLAARFPHKRVIAGRIYCATNLCRITTPQESGPRVIGYMGTSGHSADLQMVVPALTKLLATYRDVRFETFGSIEMPAELAAFGSRVRHHRPANSYAEFLSQLSELRWCVGLAPLLDHPFNRCKANTKWVEYTGAGIATMASDLPVYADSIRAKAIRLLATPPEWFDALQSLIGKPAQILQMVQEAQRQLREEYMHDALLAQILDVLKSAGTRIPNSLTLDH